jgi:hypothetical protein
VGKERVGDARGLVNSLEEQNFCRKDQNYRTRADPDHARLFKGLGNEIEFKYFDRND